MKTLRVAVSTLLTVFCLPLFLIAKGPTLKITIEGDDIAIPVEITEPNVLGQFQVWAGAGTWINRVPQDAGFIIDWRKGKVDVPNGLHRYEVSFHVMHQRPSVYVVFYACDPATGRGYVYLPGKGEAHYSS